MGGWCHNGPSHIVCCYWVHEAGPAQAVGWGWDWGIIVGVNGGCEKRVIVTCDMFVTHLTNWAQTVMSLYMTKGVQGP